MAEFTSSQLLSGGPTCLRYVKVITDGTNDAKAILYDNTSGSGTVVDETTAAAGNNYGGGNVNPPDGIRCVNGLYLTLTGTGASAIVVWD